MTQSPVKTQSDAEQASVPSSLSVLQPQMLPEQEPEQGMTSEQKMVMTMGGGSPEASPDQFADALEQMPQLSQANMLRQLQQSYGNSYVGAVIQRKGEGAIDSVPDGFETTMQQSGLGQPLDEETRSFMESRFEQDFGDVQVHTDSAAADAAQQIQAQAFITRRDIYFGQGRYQPHVTEGRKLIAHELTHVLQQTSPSPLQQETEHPNQVAKFVEESDREVERAMQLNFPTSIKTKPEKQLGIQTKLVIGQSNNQYEQEADWISNQVMQMPESEMRGKIEERETKEPIQRKEVNIHPSHVSCPIIMLLGADSGQQTGSATGTLTADLTSPIVVGRVVRFQTDIQPTASYNPPIILRNPYPYYIWKVFDRDTNAKVAEDWSPTNQKKIIYPRIGKFRVECILMDPNKGGTAPLTLDQDVVAEDPALAGSLSTNSDYNEAERELVDDFRSYVADAATATGTFGITARFLASILREEMANTNPWFWGSNKNYREEEISDADSSISSKAAGQSVPAKDLNRSIGVGQMKLSTAAMVQGLIPWIEADPSNKIPARTQIEVNYSALSTTTMRNIHTALAWPKSNIKLVANLLTKLKNRPTRYSAMTRTAFGTNQRACEIIATEYNIGATNSTEALANPSDYGQRIWSYMSLPLIQNFFSNS
jgi:Domain of unknown function (DUF4157)